MGNDIECDDPAFLFYPGDYLRDTQCLCERSQVAYDRIMCEHMRNICISQEQLNFFTKRLTDDEKSELMFVLKKNANGFYIPWVMKSIIKRREYSESRRKNRSSKKEKDDPKIKKTSQSYVPHMENEIVIENENEIVFGIKKEYQISVKKVYAKDKVKIIYDLPTFFGSQMEQLERAGWLRFDDFMKENPGRVFDDDNHVYNAFKKFHTTTETNKVKKLRFQDL